MMRTGAGVHAVRASGKDTDPKATVDLVDLTKSFAPFSIEGTWRRRVEQPLVAPEPAGRRRAW
jgi:hypothetical protein